MTYQAPEVADYINRNLVPWQVDYLDDKEQVGRFRVEWTPCLVIMDAYHSEHNRSLGFISPPELLAFLHFSRGLAAYHHNELQEAAKLFDQVIGDFPASHVAPKAIWFRGVSRFQIEGAPAVLKATRLALEENYPRSIWTEKASAWGVEPVLASL